jgi:tetratricopeptide (TPR) repeat protein
MPYSPMQLAEAFIKTGELTDALDALNQQLTEQPTDDEARRLRADVLLRLAEVDYLKAALADLQALTEYTAADYQRESVLHERLGDMDKALAVMHKARQLSPDDERLTERLLNLHISQKQYAEALERIREQVQSWRWLQYEGDVLVLSGDDKLAIAKYEAVLELLEEQVGRLRADYLQAIKARVILALAHAYRRLQQVDTARLHYELAQTLIPKDPTISFNLGLLDALSDNLERAVNQCKSALKNSPKLLHDEMLDSIRDDATYSTLWQKISET